MKDLFTIISRLWWLLPHARTPWTPVPWARCHCGELADMYIDGSLWCSPCKYVMHDTCECSQPEETR
ncbi:hypothetical protein [Nocardia asiatica]|uniref:hypothetical protein n=1 Tax=Nocardia asiatica TaxID=209252 RepID=UPI0024576213|nr:hypothetical protein [Nocardia asiatica]